MALALGNKTYKLSTPSSTTQSWTHNHNTGSGGYLFIMIAMSSAAGYTSITYNGVAMTKLNEVTTNTTSTRWAIYYLANPTTGVNTVTATFSTAQYNPVSSITVSFTGSSGPGNYVFKDTAASPASSNITVSANSMILAGEISGNTTSIVITLDGSSRTIEFTHNINNYHSTAISASGLTAGSKSVSVAGNTNVAGYYVEIKEVAAAVVSGANFLLFM